MGFNNIISVISNDEALIEQISSKLVLLRDLDKIISNSYEGAMEFLNKEIPNVIILHCQKDDALALELIKKIRQDKILKQTPILLLDEFNSRETIIDAFDSGINDMLEFPCENHQLLIRTIWCIQKDELNTNIRTNSDFMKQLGVLNKSGIYEKDYCKDFLKSQLETVKERKMNACLMLITPKLAENSNLDNFIEVINKSVRLNDIVAAKNDNEFYIFLPKTKLNGVYPVFERINKNLNQTCQTSASVIELKGEYPENIEELLENSLKRAKEETNALIVASSAFLKDPNAGINLSKQKPVEANNLDIEVLAKHAEISQGEKENSKIYRQAYRQKCKVVFEPVFEKYQNIINAKIKDVSTRYEATVDKTVFAALKNNVRASLTITYGGMYKARVDSAIMHFGIAKSSNTIALDFVDLNFKKLSEILEELYGEFKKYLETNAN